MAEWKLSNDLLGKMAARRMARGETIQSPRYCIDHETGVGLVTFGKDPETGEGIPDCLVDMERVRDADEAL